MKSKRERVVRRDEHARESATSVGNTGQRWLPAIALPKGGGALHGIGEKLTTHPATGMGTLAVPIATSPGRNGFSLGFELGYDSGAGNGPFGLGWQLSVPAIARKTDKGLPRYTDDDVFVLSGAEDLVPVRRADGTLDDLLRDGFRVQRFRPRVEAAFARIERWTALATSAVHWRAITRDNACSIFGRSSAARLADPAHPERVFAWLLEEIRDDRGNVARYVYKAEDGAGIDPGQASEAGRFVRNADGAPVLATTAQRYLKRVWYGNRAPIAREQPAPDEASAWLFEVVFDYGEHAALAPTPDEDAAWSRREDPFSSYRATFEIRTYRRCQRALMFHRFAELGAAPCLVRSTDFAYEAARVRSVDGGFDSGPIASCLASVTHAGYVRTADGYERATLPALALGYAPAVVDDAHHALDPAYADVLPDAARGANAQWVDLDGEGLPGVLTTCEGGWYYRANRGGGVLAPPVLQRTLPAGIALSTGAKLVDLDGDGHLELVDYALGYHERGDAQAWAPFAPFAALPVIDWSDPTLRWLDLDGDGLPDVVIAAEDAFLWYRSCGAAGFAPAVRVPVARDGRDTPVLVAADPTEAIFLADMSGDGLVDLVRVRNGEVCYWPSLGHGRFGRKVVLDHSPRFDAAGQFSPGRIVLADLDGSGASDVIYLGATGITAYVNRAGNALSPGLAIRGLPGGDPLARVSVVDLLGHGTACLVWASSDPARSPAYVEPFSDKPYVLTSTVNNLGGETRLRYAPSTRFYLDDLAAGQPWLTRLAFPVHVIERIERIDHVAGTQSVTRFRYHHGFYDGVEREFHGFACVEQWDAEQLGEALAVPPVRVVTWFHTGAWLEAEPLEVALARAYYAGDPQAPRVAATQLPVGSSTRDAREAARALRGQMLRQEVYADDGTAAAADPYVVSVNSYAVRLLQAGDAHVHAVCAVQPQDTLELHYERDASDPRVQHQCVLAVDELGTVTQSVAIAYPRRAPAVPAQAACWIIATTLDVAHLTDAADAYRVGVPVGSQLDELTGLVATGAFTAEALRDALAAAAVLPFEANATGALERRTVKRERARYYRDDLGGPLPHGAIESRALPYEHYQQVLTPGLIAQVYGDRVDAAMLAQAGYVLEDGAWWAPSGRAIVDPAKFYLPIEAIDPFGEHHRARYDGYALLAEETEDPLGNRTTVGERDASGALVASGHDYRVLAPSRLTDANRNGYAVALDALGQVAKTALIGKPELAEGDTLDDPTTHATYDLHAWATRGAPSAVHSFERERHGAGNARWLEAYHYSDGSGRTAMVKAQAEPGLAPVLDADGHIVRDSDGQILQAMVAARWVGSGRTIFDNKGNPVQQYEPFFSATPAYDAAVDVAAWGVTATASYDPLSRAVRTALPDGSVRRVAFTAWRHEAWDQNDAIAGTAWLARHQAGTASEQRAATLALAHAGTPSIVELDGLAREVAHVADNGARGSYETRIALDVVGVQREIVDARGASVVRQVADMLGRAIHAVSSDAGESRVLLDVGGRTVYEWTARGDRLRRGYDALRRQTHLFVQRAGAGESLVERAIYGEGHPEAEARNLRGARCASFDGAGVAISARRDLHGHVVETTRRLTADYHAAPDWAALAAIDDPVAAVAAVAGLLAPDALTTTASFDALDRVTAQATPDGSVLVPSYNAAGLLDQLAVRVRGAATPTTFLSGLGYNARGDRTQLVHGNGATTIYDYEPDTFRLSRQRTTRAGTVLRDVAYTYDPVGSVVETRDAVAYGRPDVSADGRYEYDAIYQLISAEGREHPGQQPAGEEPPLLALDHPSDLQALRRYREQYTYDATGNLTELAHVPLGSGPAGWTRRYHYANASNRLLGNSVPSDPEGTFSATYGYDAAGNQTAMPHLAQLAWDAQQRLAFVDRGGGGAVYFAYDAAGQRVRKCYEHGAFVEERVYFDGYEIYRKRNRATGEVALARENVHVRDDERRALIETKTIDLDVPAFTPVTRVRYQLADHLDSTGMELDDAGAVITYEEFLPYGGTAWQATSSTLDASRKRYRYTGHERDEETGLDYHGARYYAAWLGRWTSADPSGLIDGLNLYRYAQNRPLVFTDPTGRWSWGKVLGFAAAVVVGVAVTAVTAGAAGPVVAGILGGAAAGAAGEVVEAAVDRRPIELGRVLKSAAIGAAFAGAFSGLGALLNRTGIGKAIAARIADSRIGRAVAGALYRLAISPSPVAAATRTAGAAVAQGIRRLEQVGEAAASKLGGPFAKRAAANAARREATERGLAAATADAEARAGDRGVQSTMQGEVDGAAVDISTRSGADRSTATGARGPKSIDTPTGRERGPGAAEELHPDLHPHPVRNAQGLKTSRAFDGEIKLFSHLLFSTRPGARGLLNLGISVESSCASCRVNLWLFRASRPGIDVVTDVPLPYDGALGALDALLPTPPPSQPVVSVGISF